MIDPTCDCKEGGGNWKPSQQLIVPSWMKPHTNNNRIIIVTLIVECEMRWFRLDDNDDRLPDGKLVLKTSIVVFVMTVGTFFLLNDVKYIICYEHADV